AENPLRIERYAFLPDSGGPGRYRGALGILREYRILADDAVVQVRSDRFVHEPWGLFGGESASVARNTLDPGTAQEQVLPSKFVRRFARGAVIRAEMAGSGGYGPAFERDPEAVARDVVQEKITPQHAAERYGVVVREGAVDHAATTALRARRPA